MKDSKNLVNDLNVKNIEGLFLHHPNNRNIHNIDTFIKDLLNKNKIEYLQQLEDELYQNAVALKKIKIY